MNYIGVDRLFDLAYFVAGGYFVDRQSVVVTHDKDVERRPTTPLHLWYGDRIV